MLAPIASGAGKPATAPVEMMGLRFRNRIGLGAGFDKDGVAIAGWAALGFGFVELGTVTPRPQAGNPPPRLFRLPKDTALVNRMGFNNAGADALAASIAEARPRLPEGFVVGVNIGRNRDGGVDDYPAAAETVAPVADYLAITSAARTRPASATRGSEAAARAADRRPEAAPSLPLVSSCRRPHAQPACRILRAIAESRGRRDRQQTRRRCGSASVPAWR